MPFPDLLTPVILLTILVVSFFLWAMNSISQMSEPVTSTPEVFGLTESEIINHTNSATHGDADSAYRLARFYEMVPPFDFKRSIMWLKKAQELGKPGLEKHISSNEVFLKKHPDLLKRHPKSKKIEP